MHFLTICGHLWLYSCWFGPCGFFQYFASLNSDSLKKCFRGLEGIKNPPCIRNIYKKVTHNCRGSLKLVTINTSEYQFIIHDERTYSNSNQWMITLKSLNPLTTSPNFTSKESPILHVTLSSEILRFQVSSTEEK